MKIGCLFLVWSCDSSILKSELDRREYRNLVLDNAMEVMLIRDKDTLMSGTAVGVHVGWMYDPVDYQGLAHFLEHMLFLGNDVNE